MVEPISRAVGLATVDLVCNGVYYVSAAYVDAVGDKRSAEEVDLEEGFLCPLSPSSLNLTLANHLEYLQDPEPAPAVRLICLIIDFPVKG